MPSCPTQVCRRGSFEDCCKTAGALGLKWRLSSEGLKMAVERSEGTQMNLGRMGGERREEKGEEERGGERGERRERGKRRGERGEVSELGHF